MNSHQYLFTWIDLHTLYSEKYKKWSSTSFPTRKKICKLCVFWFSEGPRGGQQGVATRCLIFHQRKDKVWPSVEATHGKKSLACGTISAQGLKQIPGVHWSSTEKWLCVNFLGSSGSPWDQATATAACNYLRKWKMVTHGSEGSRSTAMTLMHGPGLGGG